MSQVWPSRTLGDVCQIRPPKAEARERLQPDDLVSFLPMEDLAVGCKFASARLAKPLSSVSGSYTYFADGDVLLPKISPCFENGKIGIASGLHNGIGFGSSEYIVFRPDAPITNEWLYYFLSRAELREEGSRLTYGTVGQRRIPKEFIESYPIPVPPLAEQQRIVAILDEAFDGIAIAKASAARNLEHASAVFASHLDAITSGIGMGWAEKTLGEVCRLFQGLCINAKTKHLLVESSSRPLLRIKDLRDGSAEQYVAESGWPENAAVSESDIIYTRTGQIGLVFRGRAGVLHNNCFKVVPSSGLSGDYLYWWLQSPGFRQKIVSLASKAAQPDITHALFKLQSIQVPSIECQAWAVARIEAVHRHSAELQDVYRRKERLIGELRESLLNEAFSGNL